MAPGANFTLIPNVVETIEPVYNTVITQSESMKKEYLAIAATPTERYRLKFFALSNTNRDTLITHFKDNSGGYYLFTWASVPSYIGSGANISGRWVDGSLTMTPVGGKFWAVSIIFEKAVP